MGMDGEKREEKYEGEGGAYCLLVTLILSVSGTYLF